MSLLTWKQRFSRKNIKWAWEYAKNVRNRNKVLDHWDDVNKHNSLRVSNYWSKDVS